MSSLNKVMLIGNLGRDPETRYMPSGDAVTSIAIATSETWKDKTTGEKKEKTEWHRCTAFGKLAEIMGQYLTKGSKVYIEGSLTTRKYTDKDGVEKYATEIKVDQMRMLSAKQDNGQNPEEDYGRATTQRPAPQPAQQRPAAQQQRPAQRPAPSFDDMDDDIPFIVSLHDVSPAATSKGLLRAKFGRGNALLQAHQGEF